MNTRHTLPGDIERTSMSIIAAELAERGVVLPPEQEAVVKRVIHTTADFDYANNLRFTPGAAELGQAALKRGVPIVTDTNMAKAGISKPSLEAFGCTLRCFMAEPEVARLARERGLTRAAVSMERAAQEYPGAILAVGNAPTALLRIAELMEEGLRPALVIAVPVGFVNVVESKELLFAACETPPPEGGSDIHEKGSGHFHDRSLFSPVNSAARAAPNVTGVLPPPSPCPAL